VQNNLVFYQSNDITIRNILDTDPQIICTEEIKQGWQGVSEDKYLKRLADQAAGKAIALVAEYKGNVAGYINIYDFSGADISTPKYCHIIDFGVLEKYRKHGIGSKLMDIAEQIAAECSDTVYLGVGLHSGYGSAQRMYIKRGYIPDGNGVWYGHDICKPYEMYCNDDDLNLHLSKKLR
jgi:ribosomal protein S18 acetylase RimI-like enzyme